MIDNLLSAEQFNLPVDPRVTFIEGSITNDQILSQLKDDLIMYFILPPIMAIRVPWRIRLPIMKQYSDHP